MYYLTVRNLGVERCIHCSEVDEYTEGMSYSCAPDLGHPGSDFLRELRIRCAEVPDKEIVARVYRD